MLSLGAYLAGVAELAVVAVALGFGARGLRGALLPGWAGAPARLVEVVVAVSSLLVVCQLLGLLGLFDEWPLVAACVAVGTGQWVVACFVPDREDGASVVRRRAFGGHRLQFGLAVVAGAVAFAHWSAPTLEALDRGIYGFDSQWYHLPFAARFAETGSIWDFHHTTPVLLSWFYPANSELLHSVGMLLFERDLLSPLVNLGWLALALLAAWCVGRPWGVGGLSALGAFVVLDAGLFADQAGEARNDVMGAAGVLAAAALVVQRPIPLAASGLAAGLALGTRFTSLAPVAALTAGAVWLARSGRRLGSAAIWAAALVATGGLWYLRNLIATGNPLPQVTELGPLSLPGPDQALGGRPSFSVARYATDFGVWGDWFAPALGDGLGLLWPLVLALAATGAILAVVRGPSRPVRVVGAVAIVTAVAYLFTPVTASGPEGEPVGFGPNLRYLAPGLALALAILPVAVTGLGFRLRLAAAVALAAAAGAVAAEPDRWEGVHLLAAAVAGLLVALALAGIALALRSRSVAGSASRHGSPGRQLGSSPPSNMENHAKRGIDPPRDGEDADADPTRSYEETVARGSVGPAVAAGLAVVALFVVAAGYFEQRGYLEDRYADPAAVLPNPGLDSVFAWARGVEDARIATTTTRQYPLYGTELSNHVQFVGIERPEGGFTSATSCEEWRAAVDEGQYDYVVTAPDRAEPGETMPMPERIWTKSSPSATEIVDDGPATVYELDGPLDSDRCDEDIEAGQVTETRVQRTESVKPAPPRRDRR